MAKKNEQTETEKKPVFIPSPKQIYNHLNEYVIGQEEAKRILSVAVYNHYKRFLINNYGALDNSDGIEIEKSNILMLGNTGTGKTHLIKTVAKFLGVPCYIADSTKFSSSGYVGDDVENCLVGLLRASNFDVAKAEMGIVALDECFSGDVEVMTENGFIQFKDLSEDVKIMQWNDNFTMNLVKPLRIVKHPCVNGLLSLKKHNSGELIHYSTPNHNRVVISHGKHHDKYIIKKVVADKSTMEGYNFPISGIYDGNDINMSDDMIRLSVAFAADGCIKNKCYGYISFKKERKYKRLVEILNNLKYQYTVSFNEETKYYNFYLGRVDNTPFFNDGKKTLQIKGLLLSSIHQKEIFLKELKYWDGYVNYKKEDSVYFTSGNYEEVKFVQTSAHTSGYMCSINNRFKKGYKNTYYCIIRKKKDCSQQGKIDKEYIKYNDDVYCVTVPSGMIMIRYNNFITITGNCDKLATKSENPSITRDVGGECVQQELLKIVEGGKVSVPPQGGRKHPQQETIEIDTTNILFIGLGAFAGLDKMIMRRCNKSSVGYNNPTEITSDKVTEDNYLSKVETEDLRRYGLIPEFLGRFPIVTHTNPLKVEDLIKILTEPKNAITKQYQKLLSVDNINLTFSKDALATIANIAISNKTGARGLRKIIENVLTDIMFEYGGTNLKVKKVTVDNKYLMKYYPDLITDNTDKKKKAA